MGKINTEAVKEYVKQCLAQEEKKPVGMFGNWAYFMMKKRELEESNPEPKKD